MNRTPEERDRWDSPGRKLLGPRPAEPERRKESRQKRSWRVKHKEFAEKYPKERNQEEMGTFGWGGSTQKPAPRHSRHTRSPSSSLEMRDVGQAPAPPLSGAALGQRPSQTPGPQTLTELPAMAGTRDRQCWWWVWLLGPQVEAGRDRPCQGLGSTHFTPTPVPGTGPGPGAWEAWHPLPEASEPPPLTEGSQVNCPSPLG